MDGPTIPQSNERYNGLSDSHMNKDAFSVAIQSLFIGNLRPDCETEDVNDIFRRPILSGFDPITVQRIDLKKGFCFVFFKDAKSLEEKERAERYMMELNGMYVLHFCFRSIATLTASQGSSYVGKATTCLLNNDHLVCRLRGPDIVQSSIVSS
jgi:hypothetical protein